MLQCIMCRKHPVSADSQENHVKRYVESLGRLLTSRSTGEIVPLAQIAEVAPIENTRSAIVGINHDFQPHLRATELEVADYLETVDLGIGGDVIAEFRDGRGA